MIIAPLHRYFRPDHLVAVMAEMARRGAPVLRAHFDAVAGVWLAREGTHRLRAAHNLGLTPVLVPVPWWRTRKALERARYAARDYGYVFAGVGAPVWPMPGECGVGQVDERVGR